MTVGYVISSLATGGAEMMLLRYVRHLDRPVVVFHLGGNDELQSAFEDAGATVVNLDVDSIVSPRELESARRTLRGYDIDILHAHLPSSMVVARTAGRAAGIDTVVSTHHNATYPRGIRAVERATRTLGTHQIAVSDSVRRSQQSPLSSADWSVVHNGIDLESFTDSVANADLSVGFDTHGPVFLNIGRYVEQKGQKYLIAAMRDVVAEFPDAQAFIVGHGPLQGELEAAVSNAGLESNVTVTGKVPEVYPYYASADVFVFASLFEGLPVTGLEAMAAGLPIVGTRVSGIREVVDPGDTGVLTPPESPEALAEAMITTVSSDPERMGERGVERARSQFSIEAMVDAHAELYERLRADDQMPISCRADSGSRS